MVGKVITGPGALPPWFGTLLVQQHSTVDEQAMDRLKRLIRAGTFRAFAMVRLLRRILLYTAGTVLLVVAVLVGLAYAYQDEVQAKLVAALNSHLRVPVSQSGMDFSLLRRFPQASLRMSDVFVREVRTDSLPADTLLSADELYIEIGLFALFSGDYTISELHGAHVRLCPGFDTQGAENWVIWKTDSSGAGAEVDLKRVTFDGLRARYHDDRNGLSIEAASEQLALRGRFREQGNELGANGDLHLLEWRDKGGLRLADRLAELKVRMAFGGAQGGFRIEKGSEVQFADSDGDIGGAPVAVTLSVQQSALGNELDLRANGFGMDLAKVAALLPEALHKSIRHYSLNGEADIAIHYAGPLYGDGPALSAGLSVREGRVKERVSGSVFSDVRGELALELSPSGSVKKLLVKGLHARTGSGTVEAQVDLNGLKNARLKADVRADLAVADLLRFIRVDTLEEAQGRLKADAHITGQLRDVAQVRAADLRALVINGHASLHDASLKLKGVRHRLTGLNAELALKGNDALVNGLRCSVQGSPIELSGTLRNLAPYLLFPDQRLTIDARGSSPRIDLVALFTDDGPESPGTAHHYAVKFPALLDLQLAARVDELVFEDFSAQEIVCTVSLKERVLEVTPLAFRTAEGRVSGTLRVDGRPADAYPLAINADVKGMRIERLFAEFRDFGQTFITHEHLRGKGDVRLGLTAQLLPDLSLDQNSLHSIADLRIYQGELNNHAPMMAVADYLRTNKLVSPFVDTEELRRRLTQVKFAVLENQVEIKDRTVFVPAMTVKSSAMDIEVSAAQTFDGGVDDHINFRLGDLFKLGTNGQDEFGPVVDDGTGLRIFLHMYGTTSDLKFKNDGAAANARRKDKIKQESQQLKGLLADIWKGKAQEKPATTGSPIITVEAPRDTSEARTVAVRRKTGLGKLLEGARKEEEEEVITIE